MQNKNHFKVLNEAFFFLFNCFLRSHGTSQDQSETREQSFVMTARFTWCVWGALNAPTHIKTLTSTECFVAGRSSIFNLKSSILTEGNLWGHVFLQPPPRRSWRPPRSPPRHAGAKSPTRGKSLVFISDFQEFLMKCCEVVICPLCHESSIWGLFSYAAAKCVAPGPRGGTLHLHFRTQTTRI